MFDWLPGKWFDTFCPGVASADAVPGPSDLTSEPGDATEGRISTLTTPVAEER